MVIPNLRPDKPIYSTLLRVDTYKFPMGDFVYRRYRDIRVRKALICRTKGVALGRLIPLDALREEFAHARSLRFDHLEIDYLRSSPYLPKLSAAFLGSLATYALPEILVERRGDDLSVEVEGTWSEILHWETIALSIVNELYFRYSLRVVGIEPGTPAFARVFEEGRTRLRRKIARLKTRQHLEISHFGLRRGATAAWEKETAMMLLNEIPDMIVGISNVDLARRTGKPTSGTCGHEIPMVMACVHGTTDEGLRDSQRRFIQEWFDDFGPAHSNPPTDTFGTASFLKALTPELAHGLTKLKHDSGDPIYWAERKILPYYERMGIDARTKKGTFSDGNTVDTMFAIDDALRGRIGYHFGWGTNCTFDVEAVPPISLVMKVVHAAGRPTVKLSDDLSKAMGPQEEIERYHRVHGYDSTERRTLTY